MKINTFFMKTYTKMEKISKDVRIIKTRLYKYIQWVQMSNKVQTYDKQMWFLSSTSINDRGETSTQKCMFC